MRLAVFRTPAMVAGGGAEPVVAHPWEEPPAGLGDAGEAPDLDRQGSGAAIRGSRVWACQACLWNAFNVDDLVNLEAAI